MSSYSSGGSLTVVDDGVMWADLHFFRKSLWYLDLFAVLPRFVSCGGHVITLAQRLTTFSWRADFPFRRAEMKTLPFVAFYYRLPLGFSPIIIYTIMNGEDGFFLNRRYSRHVNISPTFVLHRISLIIIIIIHNLVRLSIFRCSP